MTNIELFQQARKYLTEAIEPLIDTFLTGIWDPYIRFTIVRDTERIIQTDLINRFSELPKKYLPKVKFRLTEDPDLTEVNIQQFYNTDKQLNFLGMIGIGGEMFDLYFRNSFGPSNDFMFVAKYGHGVDDYYAGSKTAESEYYLGIPTPLAIAYGMAKDDGVI